MVAPTTGLVSAPVRVGGIGSGASCARQRDRRRPIIRITSIRARAVAIIRSASPATAFRQLV
jgi:hypothetical protein